MSYGGNNPDNVYLSEAEIERRKRWREAERRKLSLIAQQNVLGNASPERLGNGGYRPPLYNSSEPPVPQYQNYPPSNYPNYNDRNAFSPSRDFRKPPNFNQPPSSYPMDNYGTSSLPSNYNNNTNPMYDDNRGFSSLNRPSVQSPYSRNPPPPLSPNKRFSPLQSDQPPPNQQSLYQPQSQQRQPPPPPQQQQQQPLGSGRNTGQSPTSFTRYRIDRLRPEEREALLEKQQKQKQLADILKQQMEEKQRKKEEEKRRKIEEDRLYNLEMERQAEEERIKAEEEKRMQEMKDAEFKRPRAIQQQQDDDFQPIQQPQPSIQQQQLQSSFDKPRVTFNPDMNQQNTSFSPSRRNVDYIQSPSRIMQQPQQPPPQQQLPLHNDLFPPNHPLNNNNPMNLYPQQQQQPIYNSPPQQPNILLQQQQQQQQALAAGMIPPQMALQNGYYMNPGAMMYPPPSSFLYPAQMILDNNKIHEELIHKESHEKEIMELVKRQTELIMQLQKKTEEVKRHNDDENPKNLSDSYIPSIIEQQQQQQQSFSPKQSYHQSELPSELFKTPPTTPGINMNNRSMKQLQQIQEEAESISSNIILPPPNYNDNKPQSPILSPKFNSSNRNLNNNQFQQSYSTIIQTTDSPALFTSSRPPTSNKFEQSLSNFSELKPVTPLTSLRANIMSRNKKRNEQQHMIPIEEQSLAGESKFNPSSTSVGEMSLAGNSEFQQLIEETEDLYNKTKTNKISPIQSTQTLLPFTLKSTNSKTNILTPNTLRENGKTLLSPPRIYDDKNENDNNDDDSDFSSDFEDMDPISRTLTFKIPKVKSPSSYSSTLKVNSLKPEEKVKIYTEPSLSFLSQPKKPSTPQNDGSSPKYFKTMTDKMTTTGEFRAPRRPNSIM